METFVVRIFVDDAGSIDRPHGVVEHIGTGISAVFDGPEMLLEVVQRGLERVPDERRGQSARTGMEEAPG
jgi:hypothetical protein